MIRILFNKLLGIKCIKPKGALYAFPDITETGMNDETFSRVMLEEAGVALLPASNFGKYGTGYVRLFYANTRKNILEGLDRMTIPLEERIQL